MHFSSIYKRTRELHPYVAKIYPIVWHLKSCLFCSVFKKLSFSIIRYMSQAHTLPHKRLPFSTISTFFVDRFGRFIQFYYLDFDKEAISDDCRSENSSIGGFLNFK